MLKLRKIYLDNFKGISDRQIIDFENHNFSILSGPNGFGKTTIFDAIEICLRGVIERTIRFSNVTKNNHDYLKAFYQNNRQKDVVIKLLLQDTESGQYHTIIKYLSKDHDGRVNNSRRFRPDSWGIVQTYYTADQSKFDDQFTVDTHEEVTQQKVDQIFFSDQSLSQKNLYPLFNYLQQEENIYFLKKDEEEKKSQLDFLFQTHKDAAELNQISSTLNKIKGIADDLQAKLNRLGEVQNQEQPIAYQKLFSEKSFPYDEEEPFLNKSSDELDEFYNALKMQMSAISDFLINFDSTEYNKDKVKNSINFALTDRQLLLAFILVNLAQDSKINELENLSRKRRGYIRLLQTVETDLYDEDTVVSLGFDDKFIADYESIIKRKSALTNSLDTISKIVAELLDTREKILNVANRLPEHIHDPANCPLCDANYSSPLELINVIDNKTTALSKFNEDQLAELDAINADILKQFRNPIVEKTERFLSDPANKLDEDFFGLVKEARAYRDRIDRFRAILQLTSIDFDTYIISAPVSKAIIDEMTDNIANAMKVAAEGIVVDEAKLVNKHLFKDLFTEDNSQLLRVEEVQRKAAYIEFKYNQARYFSAQVLSRRLEKFRTLEEQIRAVRDVYAESIRKYKLEMIERIKIPFYLFSGKILQNYQQGLGIFIDMQQNTNRVRFLTDCNSDHDIVHHLSSGQLAVVSIAFCLALNKVYRTSQHFKFLAIDDPVQTLDDVNVHSFIELVRHEFSDYQILMSTHEDEIASYLQYKFQIFGFSSVNLNVQKEFFPVT